MNHKSSYMVREAVNALRRINTTDIAQVIGEVVTHEDRRVRETAIDGMVGIGDAVSRKIPASGPRSQR